ncbi:MAG: VCBS repeat-containing protein [Ginsengibacter sp.]
MIALVRIFGLTFLTFFLLLVTKVPAQNSHPLFKLLPASETGITFKNQLAENDTLNILNQANIYNGGGVGIGDFNRDGLMDVYFAGNMVSNKLYLNKGSLKFSDITDTAMVGGEGRWCTGVSVVDINGDGWPDIYVCASFRSDPKLRTNLLYINQGLNKEGVPTFKESALAYGLADTGFSTQAYFFDYDHDGDLDMYLVTNEIYDPKTPIRFRPKVIDGSAKNTDRLYRNNGNGTFTDLSKEAGITIEGWGHAACITDINKDGWPDIYVANDFVSNDLCYINNKDGTFTNRIGEYFKHTAWNAMGTDAVDINNDGLVDFVSLEMLPEDNLRKKRMLSGNEYYNYTNSALYGYQHQYVRNMLQLNSGNTPEGHPVFDDVGCMAGIYQTDWSWCPLVADFDNDGLRDMIITNGLPRDVTDLDYVDFNNGQRGNTANYSLAMTDSLPVVKFSNYAFKNTSGIIFKNTTDAWGLNIPTFSNGAAYVDLDNDGDLDFIINNLNDPAFVYENTLNDANRKSNAQNLIVNFEGTKNNREGIGATLNVFYDGNKQQYYEQHPVRGYLSTDDPRAHFGLGTTSKIDSLLVTWPDGKKQLLKDIDAGKPVTVSYHDAVTKNSTGYDPFKSSYFTNTSKSYGINYKPPEIDFVDYNIQATIPHKLSQYGPGIAVGDIDGNGFDDLYVGGSSGNPGVFFMQDSKGHFKLDSSRLKVKDDRLYEDMGAIFFDANGDKFPDLYLVSGSYEIPPNHPISSDRLFMNDGTGHFIKTTNALPGDSSNGSCVRAADFDGDGQLDLFVGGRVISGAYPLTPQSFLLKNMGGKFIDVTEKYCPQLKNIGMVTDALWTDFDNDGKVDLIVVGEWMPITFLKNTGHSFVIVKTGIEDHTGWWNSIVAGDFDNDGDMDYIVGNLGLNSNYDAPPGKPMTIIAKDIDQNGSIDPMVFCYIKAPDGSYQPYPVSSRDDLVSQVISMRKKFPTYKAYGYATMNDIWSDNDKQDALVLTASDLQTSYIENNGDDRFSIKALPLEAQEAPVYGMVNEDVDGDGNIDVLMVGNDYGMDPYSGRHDAFNGLCLLGDGKGNFKPVDVSKSGFFVKGDAKGLATVHTARGEDIIIATQNQDSLMVFSKNPAYNKSIAKWITLQPGDFYADVVYKDGRKRRVEFYYGSTYLSQSSRRLPVENDFEKISITNYKGIKRKVL